ncbi:Sad1 / UNC-like C-terminal family protein [Babesia bovis T2Bo]|uniref:SUN domain-containing protein n=1 Tax=Babesia bovis TaxID=5865 RepID=A7AW08_BABBO|nr:Sad1 / UNC-like C-terminal family protein [Babesia bovis T2Bo]EDO05236.1 Sad1 / UNC-like C-terminal family protein [Babesia bovis T2Bo]|eukprot:XP_001608804.1 hypothetical protein [Babesia bovis T2Bo]
MSILLTHKHKKRYVVQVIFCILTLYGCLRHIFNSYQSGYLSANSVKDAKRYNSKTVKGKPFDSQTFKLKVDFLSEDAGAIIVAQSKDISHLKSIQNDDPNSYLLAPCQKTDWFIISFPERISVKYVAFISNEYYASTYKTIRISRSSVYPSEKWHILAELETEMGQSEIFDLSLLCDKGGTKGCWTKYIKVEFLDYHRFEDNYYCSLTSMKVYGSTAVDLLESEITDDINPYKGTNVPYGQNTDKVTEIATIHIKEPSNDNKLQPGWPDNYSGRVVFGKSKRISKLVCPATITNKYDTIHVLLFKFMASLAKRKDLHGINHRLYPRMKRFIYEKDCGVRSLLSFWSNNALHHVTNCKSKTRCWKMLFHVQLPLDHTWFEKVIYRMIKQGWIKFKVPWTFRGILSTPILLCVRRYGFLGRFTCYYYFSYTSFTLTSNQKIVGYIPTRVPDLSFKCIYILFSDRKLKKVAPVSKKDISEVFNGHTFVKGTRMLIADDSISSIILSRDLCALTINAHMFQNADHMKYLMDLVLKSYVAYKDNVVSRVTKDLGLVRQIANSLDRSNTNFTRLHIDNMDGNHVGAKGDGSGGIWENIPDSNFISDQRIKAMKETKGHEHVLLQISERVKALENIVAEFRKKQDNSDVTLGSCLEHLQYVANKVQRRTYQTLNVTTYGRDIDSEFSKILNILGIKRYHIIYVDDLPRKPVFNKMLQERKIAGSFILQTVIVEKGSSAFNKLKGQCCHITGVVPKQNKGRCHVIIALIKLSKYMPILRRLQVLDCCRRFGCVCIRYNPPDSSYLVWLPHFSGADGTKIGCSLMGPLYSFIVSCSNHIFAPVIAFFEHISLAIFNIYTLFLCFFFFQAIWFYRERNTRVMIYEMSKHIKKLNHHTA